jgi:regulator of sigma E protease
MIYINLLIIFLLIIFIHELGHYFAARLFGAKVTDFSIGFGKTIYQFTDKNMTKWKISLIPLGGYVKIKGLDNVFQNQKKKEYELDSFRSLTLIKKIIILLAGSIFNIISAWLCLLMSMYFIGITSFSNEIGEVIENSPAFNNDIRKGDIIIGINSSIINDFADIPKAIGDNKFINLKLIRGKKIKFKTIELEFNDKINKYIIGIRSSDALTINRYDLNESIKQSSLFIPNYYRSTVIYLKDSIKKNTITKELSGPIGIVKMADKLMLDKIKGVLFFFIVISLFVSVFNLLPIPLLDGGHIIYFIVRKIFSDSLPDIITKIYLGVGFAIISFLFFIVTFNDIFYK